MAGSSWKFLAGGNAQPQDGAGRWMKEAKERVQQLEDELRMQFAPPLAGLEEGVLEGWGGRMGAGTLSSLIRPLGMSERNLGAIGETGAPTLPDDEAIPSDPLDQMPVLGRSGRLKRVKSRPKPPSVALSGGGEDETLQRSEAPESDVRANPPTEEEKEERSPSPVIIWRHAAPIKLAENVPAELLPPGQADAREAALKRHAAQNAAKEAAARRSAEGGAAAGSPLRKSKPRQGAAYGQAWYLPVEQWEASAKGMDLGADKTPDTGGSKSGDEGVAQLYSSRVYLGYLKEKKVSRVPHYLTRLDGDSESV